MKAILYIRVSSEAQVDGTSLASQESDCRAWCKRNGYEILEVVREEGESAKTADRDGLISMLARVKKGGVDAVVVHKIDRLARNTADGLAIRAELRRRDCRLVSVTEGTSDDPVGEMVTTVLLAVGQFDNQIRAQRCRRGMESVALAGGWPFRAPVGYKLARAGNLPILEPDPKTAPTLARVFQSMAAGRMTRAEAGRALAEIGVARSSASRLLRHAIYGGIICNPLTSGRQVAAAFPGIVPAETWRLAQAPLGATKIWAVEERGFLLSGVARCAVCGIGIRGDRVRSKTGRKYHYYDCKHGHVRAPVDQAHTDLERIMRTAWTASLRDLRSMVVKEAAAEADVGRANRAAAEAKRTAAEARLARLVDGYTDGVIDAETYRKKAAQYRQEIGESKLDAGAAQAGIDALSDGIDEVIESLNNPLVIWRKLDRGGRIRLAELLGARLVITKEGRCENRTLVTAASSNELPPSKRASARMVGRAGIEPATP